MSSGKRKIKEEVKDESDETETPSAKKQKLDKSATEEGDDKTPKKKKKKKSKDEVKEEAEEEGLIYVLTIFFSYIYMWNVLFSWPFQFT